MSCCLNERYNLIVDCLKIPQILSLWFGRWVCHKPNVSKMTQQSTVLQIGTLSKVKTQTEVRKLSKSEAESHNFFKFYWQKQTCLFGLLTVLFWCWWTVACSPAPLTTQQKLIRKERNSKVSFDVGCWPHPVSNDSTM